jgi:hypothetical protein
MTGAALQLGAFLLMAAGTALCDQKNGGGRAAKPAPPPRGMLSQPNANPNVNKGGQPKAAPKMPNPANEVQQLLRMSPAQRDRILEKYPPERQAQLRKRLENFDNQPPAERERQLKILDNFSRLPPEKQTLVRTQIQAYNELPDERRAMVLQAYRRLSRMPESSRRAWLDSDPFKNRFTPAEQQILSDLTEYRPLFPVE